MRNIFRALMVALIMTAVPNGFAGVIIFYQNDVATVCRTPWYCGEDGEEWGELCWMGTDCFSQPADTNGDGVIDDGSDSGGTCQCLITAANDLESCIDEDKDNPAWLQICNAEHRAQSVGCITDDPECE